MRWEAVYVDAGESAPGPEYVYGWNDAVQAQAVTLHDNLRRALAEVDRLRAAFASLKRYRYEQGPCPLCEHNEDGVLVRRCEMHVEIELLRGRLQLIAERARLP